MSEVVQQLEAGGLVPVDATVPSDLPTDTVDARVYTNPGIPDRVVVRIVPDAIARGIDTEMGLFGFQMTGHHDDIARQRRRTLGFPGSALVADPERARYALDVMKEFRKQAKRINSKPGHARDGFDEIAERLSRQVPHFLPSYWEEVGRAFASAANFQYAAQSFDKARTAEREFGLKVDEELRGAAFLEFALLGALTVKSLQAYGKELQKAVGGDSAYERMFQLAIRRTLGGLPPWASLPKDLRSLIKTAKRDVDVEDQRFLREVLGAPSIQRAPGSFWEEYRDAAIALGKADPAIRSRLVDLFPNGGKTRYSWRNDGDDGFQESWMELLLASGALDVLWDADAPADALPSGGRSAWFKRLQEWSRAGDGWVLQLVRKAAPVLKAEGTPVEIRTGDWSSPLDLDLLDLLIELGLPWVGEDKHYRVELAKWAQWSPAPERHGFPAEHRPRDPVFAAKDPNVIPLLAPAIDSVFGDQHFEAIAAGMSALQELRRAWLDRQVADLTVSGLAATHVALGRLEAATSPATFAEFPHAAEGMAGVSFAGALHHTLVTGVLDELGWPAFDRVAEELQFATDNDVHVTKQWPYLIVANGRKAFVLGPKGVELAHDLKLGKDTTPDVTVYVGGQLFVSWSGWSGGSYKVSGYWSGKPGDTFDVERTWRAGASNPWTTADALVFGDGRFAVGDRTSPPAGGNQVHDLDTTWTWHEQAWHRQDRATGKVLDKGGPAFLADVGGAGAYYRIPDALKATSPLPHDDGQYGFKVVQPDGAAREPDEDDDEVEENTEVTAVTLPGDRYVGSFRHGGSSYTPTMLVRWPGGGLRAVRQEDQYWRNAHNPNFFLADPDRPVAALVSDGSLRMRHGWMPSGGYWHYMVPRDLDGSRALRALSREAAAALLEAAVADEAEDHAPTRAAVKAALPALSDPTLLEGVVVVVRVAADLQKRLNALRELRKGGTVVAKTGDEVGDRTMIEVLANLGRYWGYDSSSITAEIRTLGDYLVKGNVGTDVLWSNAEPHEFLGRIRAFGWMLARPGLPEAHRVLLVKVLARWADSGLADDVDLRLGRMRIDKLEKWIPTKLDEGATVPHAAWRHWEDHTRMVVWGCDETDEGPWTVNFLEWVSDPSRFADRPSTTVVSERRISVRGDRAWLSALLEQSGARPVDPSQVGPFAEATGLTSAEAGVVLALFPPEMDKETREALGLKAAEVKAATGQISLTRDQKLELLAGAAPDDPAELFRAEVVARLQAKWLELFGKAIPVPTELVTLAEKEMWGGGAKLKKFANPAGWTELHKDEIWGFDEDGDLVVQGRTSDDEQDEESSGGGGFSGSTGEEAAQIIGWLVPKLPAHDVLAANAGIVHQKLLQRLKNRSLYMDGGTWYVYDAKAKKAGEAWFAALGGEVVVRKDDDGDVQNQQRRTGALVANLSGYRLSVSFNPATLDPSSRELLTTFAKASESDLGELYAYELLQSSDFGALVNRVTSSPLPPGAWEQNAALSAPSTVAAVAKKHGLSPEGALLYLQTLTLLDPTKKNVIAWNGWTPKVYTAAAAELVAAGLVLEAKRARAGREHFLPGGWIEAKDILPYEEWKRPLYGFANDKFPFGDPVALAPIHVLFERAWARCAGGDGPRFQEVRR